ncbi:30S ribosomal protein S4 [Candidatus Woesearchaeota archaeon]|nr:MAG: 30S ribosomal protein S4 [Candidatus Woesearchaeota archaeon]
MKRIRKQYQTPSHPWSKTRIEEERTLIKDFGLRNKREIYKMNTVLKRYKDTAKRLLARTDLQADIERNHLLQRLTNLGLVNKDASVDDILSLTIRDLLNRRLQTILVKNMLARTPLQARQFITHRHVTVGGRIVTSPGYLVSLHEEGTISFTPRSSLSNEDHPERPREEDLQKVKEQKQKKTEEEDALPAFEAEELEKAEEETT